MVLKQKWSIIELLVLVHFPFYGIFSFLRIQELKISGYLLYMLPMIFFIGWRFLRVVVNADIRLPTYIFFRGNQLHASFFLGLMLIMISGLVISAIVGSRDWTFAMAEVAMLFTVAVFWILVIESGRFKKNGLQRIFSALIISLMIYAVMNIGSVLIGFESEAHMARYTREIEAIYSPLGVRANFPFILSGQHFAILGGVLVVFSLRGTRCLGFSKITRFCMSGLGVLALIGQSARAPIAALILVLAYCMIVRKAGRGLITLLLLLIMFVPVAFVYLDAGYYLHELTVAVGLDASRSEGDVASLSNRDVIWGAALHHMFSDAGFVHGLFGYGAFGQIASGVDSSYLWLFKDSYKNQEHPSLHSTYVQALVDYGIIGIVFFTGVILVVLRQLSLKISRIRGITPDITVLLVLLYLCICAITEVILSYYAFDLLSIFLFLNLYVMAQRSVEMRMYTLFESQGELCHVLKYQ